MQIEIAVHLNYAMAQRTHLLLQLEAAATDTQQIVTAAIGLSDTRQFARIPADDGVGERIWLEMDYGFVCDYTATMQIDRAPVDWANLQATPLHELPPAVVKYLLPSRYCNTDDFSNFVDYEFGGLSGGARVLAMANWIESRFAYVPGISTSATSDIEVFVQRQGICRDFAHVLVSLCRASAIPARFVSCFAPDVVPQDFHAVVEVYLDGAWHLVDPTGMSKAETIACIGVGRDAADVAFLTSFSGVSFIAQSVLVSRL